MGLVEAVVIWLGPWSWWFLGLILLALEIIVPGMFFLWFGVSALIMGGVALFFVVDWRIQLVAWAALAVLLLLVGRRWFARPGETTDPLLNDRARRYVGRSFTLTQPLVEAAGTLKIDDTIWRITGPDLPAGARVEVVDVDGALLKVRAAG